jgi:branched-chain amino acid transport system permease protein
MSSTVLLLALTGLGLGGLYFLVASGLSLIFGLMRVLNFAHGAFLVLGAYVGYQVGAHLGTGAIGNGRFALILLAAAAAGAVIGGLTELVLIRPLYRREVDQILVTVGLSLAIGALVLGFAGADPRTFPAPAWTRSTTTLGGAAVPNSRFLAIGAALGVLVLLAAFLRYTRFGLVVRAGVENRSMVTALGIDVRRTFTLVFALGGAAAGLGGALTGVFYGSITPSLGSSLLIFAFIVVIIGGLGSIAGSAIAAIAVGLLQQFANFYAAAGVGDLSVVLLLAVVLLVRPRGLLGRSAA